jgi:hypothetical protein
MYQTPAAMAQVLMTQPFDFILKLTKFLKLRKFDNHLKK